MTDAYCTSNLNISNRSPLPPNTRENTVKYPYASSSSSSCSSLRAQPSPLSTAHGPISMPPPPHLLHYDYQSHARNLRPRTHSRPCPAPARHQYLAHAPFYPRPIPQELSSPSSCAAYRASYTRPPPPCRSRSQRCGPGRGDWKSACCAVGSRTKPRRESQHSRDGGLEYDSGESSRGYHAISPDTSCASTDLGEEKSRDRSAGGRKQRIVYRGGDVEEVIVL